MGAEKQMARKAYKRRRNNEGSITQRKNGTFQVAYIVGKKADGTPKRVYPSVPRPKLIGPYWSSGTSTRAATC